MEMNDNKALNNFTNKQRPQPQQQQQRPPATEAAAAALVFCHGARCDKKRRCVGEEEEEVDGGGWVGETLDPDAAAGVCSTQTEQLTFWGGGFVLFFSSSSFLLLHLRPDKRMGMWLLAHETPLPEEGALPAGSHCRGRRGRHSSHEDDEEEALYATLLSRRSRSLDCASYPRLMARLNLTVSSIVCSSDLFELISSDNAMACQL
ncbi:unnamed protein product [Lampetra fluviatilis]